MKRGKRRGRKTQRRRNKKEVWTLVCSMTPEQLSEEYEKSLHQLDCACGYIGLLQGRLENNPFDGWTAWELEQPSLYYELEDIQRRSQWIRRAMKLQDRVARQYEWSHRRFLKED